MGRSGRPPEPTEIKEWALALRAEGLTTKQASDQVGVHPTTLARWYRETTGMSLPGYGKGPAPGRVEAQRSPGRFLCALDRVEIAVSLRAGMLVPEIAAALGRHKSAIYREIARNSSKDGTYRPDHAQRLAQHRGARPKPRKCSDPIVRARIIEMLLDLWSPQQISARLSREGIAVSHESIYKTIYIQGRGSLREELAHQQMLRSGRLHRKARTRTSGLIRRGKRWASCNISTRPAEAADRAVPGHWEGDLIMGKNNETAIITLVERTTRFVMLGSLPEGRRTAMVTEVLTELMARVPHELRRSLAWDQGSEMAGHVAFSLDSRCIVYFCDPHSPWQRGSNENTNGLLRQYFPVSKTDFSTISQDQLDAVARQLNARPRQTLGWDTPAEKLDELLAVATTA